jgi:ribosomal protein L2
MVYRSRNLKSSPSPTKGCRAIDRFIRQNTAKRWSKKPVITTKKNCAGRGSGRNTFRKKTFTWMRSDFKFLFEDYYKVG